MVQSVFLLIGWLSSGSRQNLTDNSFRIGSHFEKKPSGNRLTEVINNDQLFQTQILIIIQGQS